MFMMPMPPTSSETDAIPPSSNEKVCDVSFRMARKSSEERMRKSSGLAPLIRCARRRICSVSAIASSIVFSLDATRKRSFRYGDPKMRNRPVSKGMMICESGSPKPPCIPFCLRTPMISNWTPVIRMCFPITASAEGILSRSMTSEPRTATLLRALSSASV